MDGHSDAVDTIGPTLVWDLPTRLFHWSLVAAVGVAIGTGLAHHMTWHLRAGFVALTLVLFRLAWALSAWQLLFIAIAVHVLAVLLYVLAKKQNLVRPMIIGRTSLPATIRAPAIRSPLLGLVLFGAIAADVWFPSTFG